jgi:hypothetical protein
LSGARVRSTVGPFTESGLDEAFGLAVGSGAIRSGEAVADIPGLTEVADEEGSVGPAVIGQEASGSDTAIGEEAECALEEGACGFSSFVSQDLSVGQSGVIVDADMGVLPTDAPSPSPSVSVDAMTGPSDAAQLLDIRVEEISRGLVFIAANGLFGLDVATPRQVMTAQDAADGRPRHATGSSHHHARQTHPPQLKDPPNHLLHPAARRAARG